MLPFLKIQKIRNLAIGQKFLIIVITSLLSVGVLGLFSIQSSRKSLSSIENVFENGQIVEQISSRLIQPINDIHSSSIFLVMNPSKKELMNVDGKVQLLIHHVDSELDSSSKEYASIEKHRTYGELIILWESYKKQVNEIRVLVERKDISAARRILFIDGKRKFQRLISILSIWQKDHIYFIQNEYNNNIIEAKNNTKLIFILLLLSACSIIFISYRLVLLIVKPIEKITSTASKIANGDMNQVATIDNEDEIGVLARTFNQMNSRLIKLNTNLELEVKQRTVELCDKTDLLEAQLKEVKNLQEKIIAQEKITSLGLLLAGVSHEIRNPLNLIENSVLIIKEIVDEIEVEKEKKEKIELYLDNLDTIEKVVDIAVNQSQRANKIIVSMLNQSRGVSSAIEKINIEEIVTRNLGYVEKFIDDDFFDKTKLIKEFDYSGEISLYEQEFGQVIVNIIENAFYAMRKKMNDLDDDSSYKPELFIKSSLDGGQLTLLLRDNGIGIPKNFLDDIFVAFKTTKPAGIGTGLGLSVSFDIVKKHSGTIFVDSVEGEFTQFTIVLPIDFS